MFWRFLTLFSQLFISFTLQSEMFWLVGKASSNTAGSVNNYNNNNNNNNSNNTNNSNNNTNNYDKGIIQNVSFCFLHKKYETVYNQAAW